MSAFNVISVIGTGITLLGFLLVIIPNERDQTTISYIIANDGTKGPNGGNLKEAGGDFPDVRLWDETGEYLGGRMDPGMCEEGRTDCTTTVDTQEAATYTLFSGNSDAICIAWTGLNWAGGQKNYGFHPGNWAYACGARGYESGNWYYAGIPLPGIDYADDAYCAWFDSSTVTSAEDVKLDYFCKNLPPVNFRTEEDPNRLQFWSKARYVFSSDPSVKTSTVPPSPAQKKRVANRRTQSLSKRMAQDTRIIKSHFQKHSAAQLCESPRSIGQPFVSYSERKFCFMPTKTLYPFCEDVEGGACWSDEENKVIGKSGEDGDDGSIIHGNGEDIPDLGHITNTIIWGKQ
ncbi:hypothetical protein CPLU01_14123 [Colletotrichum plurivorum]|uniref:Uncharacterized protein n=1 Tax=Colletotrichum plurivorum TaxID=2175906 RepID=A0A8H6JLL6_9PEZI|nr:hypothetical protein CPLU01_14123 [Colletotrichum plurivorum]